MKQFLVERTDRREPFARELAPPHPDDVEAFQPRVLAVDEAIRNDVTAHAANATHHHLRTDAGELMHGRQSADENEVTDLTVAAERRRGRKDHVVADLAVVSDMGIVHEIAALTDAGDTAAADGADVHGDALAHLAGFADLEPRRLAAIGQRLRRGAERHKGRYLAARTERRVARNVHMRLDAAFLADHDVAADDAIRSDR